MFSSPSGKHRVEQVFEGDIHFGPDYFRLAIDGRSVPNRIFGRPLQWSADSRLLAAQEWLTTDYGSGPLTCAVLIDVEAWKIARLKVVQKGFAEDFRFEGAALVYFENFLAKGELHRVDVALSAIGEWHIVGGQPLLSCRRDEYRFAPLRRRSSKSSLR